VRALTWAWEQKAGSSYAKCVLATLALFSNRDGVCWLSVSYLCFLTEACPTTIYRALMRLRALGLIKRRGRSYVLTGDDLRLPLEPDFSELRCAYCDIVLRGSIAFTVDHVVPQSRGGTDGPVVPCCRSCNSSKGAMTAEAFIG